MSLNIKNQRVHDLAREAARRTGTTKTSAIEAALDQYLAGLDAPAAREQRRARVEAVLADIDLRLSDADRAALRRDLEDLYDDQGLPT
ncbi:type II toxin-antitoxin system VapB family antitoxin [Ornithinicoccus hortensis]|uniref:Antitoxin VapB n=1 Tax=Ornithinicoccus hortensis TaxID=82346 RepID=A0A542YNV4_9MICO|nr:type II toxin-antitoxin system VapB family antitoxin [Ornithinicoccus hortensis]TQL49792.1 antitoxin VapB [Ornithinicoccus hortensis]